MKKLLLLLMAVALMTACSDRAKIKGKIGAAEKQMVYLEHLGLNKLEVVDSTKTDSDGEFKFKIEKPAYPDIYRVRYRNSGIVVALDSATEEIDILVPDSSLQLAQITGSEASADIQRLRLSHYNLQQAAYRKNLQLVDSCLKAHTELAREIIMKDPKSMAAYYAINQTFNGNFYVSPYDKTGIQLWSAVATAFDMNYPEYERSKELKAATLSAIRNARATALDVDRIMQSGAISNMIDIELPNRKDEIVKLSSLIGRLVLIDFSAYSMEQANAHMLFLRELYEVYHPHGFEIYQISVDPSKLQWLEQSHNIPWTCVRDERSTQSPYLLTYNVTEIPTFFLMARDGTILGRYNHSNLETAISRYLGEN